MTDEEVEEELLSTPLYIRESVETVIFTLVSLNKVR